MRSFSRPRARGLLILAITILSLLSLPVSCPAQSTTVALSELSGSFEALSRTVSPAVVQILSTGYAPGDRRSADAHTLISKQQSTGSGVILDPNGYIMTNAHVVEGAQRIRVLLAGESSIAASGQSILKPKGTLVGAQLVGIDYETDLALLRIYRENLPHLQLGDSEKLRQGQLVFAFGSPLGLENSVSMGVVSSVARQLTPEDPMIYVQTDAPINPGNSGGPLVNTAGEVVGINTLIFSQSGGSEGIGFAAPSNIVSAIYEQLKTTGTVQRGMVGIHAQTVTPILATGLNLPRTWGVVVGDVYPGSPAETAGMMAGDYILTLDGKSMENGRQFDVNLYQRSVGEKVTVRFLRGADTLVKQIAVVERPSELNRYLRMVTPEKNLVSQLGILAVDYSEEVKSMLPGVRVDKGVVVAANTARAVAWDGGFRSGDVIFAVNGRAVGSLLEIRTLAESLQPGEPVVARIDRQGKQIYIAFEAE